MVELHRSHEHLDQRRSDRSAVVDSIESTAFSSQESLRGIDVRIPVHVKILKHGMAFVMLTELLGSVSLRFVSSSIGTDFQTLTI